MVFKKIEDCCPYYIIRYSGNAWFQIDSIDCNHTETAGCLAWHTGGTIWQAVSQTLTEGRKVFDGHSLENGSLT